MTESRDPRERLNQDAFADHLNMQLSEARPGFARAEMEAAEEFSGLHGYIHAGAILALAEFALAAASNAEGTGAIPLSLSVNFAGLVRPGRRLVAEAVEEKLGRRTGLYAVHVRLEDGTLVAAGQGLTYRQEPPATSGPGGAGRDG